MGLDGFFSKYTQKLVYTSFKILYFHQRSKYTIRSSSTHLNILKITTLLIFILVKNHKIFQGLSDKE